MIDVQKFVQCVNGSGHTFSPAQVAEDGVTVYRACQECGYQDTLLYVGQGNENTGMDENGDPNVQPRI